ELDEDEDDELDEDDENGVAVAPSAPPSYELAMAAAPETVPDDEGEQGTQPPPDDPGARRRYRFKHPTASGKTIAAAGFVDAARTTGVLILTHRRLLVDQFTRDLTKEGYGSRLHEAVLVGDRTPDTPPLTINTYS